MEALLNLAAGATRADPATVQVDIRGPDDAGVASGPLTKVDAGLYAGSFALTTNNGEVVAVTASYPAANLTSPKVYATTDFDPPTFLLSWTAPVRNNGTVGEHADERDSALAGAFKRDEQVRVVVTSDQVIEPGSVFLKVTGVTDAGTPGREEELIAVQPGGVCGSPYCGEAVVDAWKPQFDLVRGRVFAEVSGKDEAGNTGKADAGIPVTRVRWVFDYGTGFNFRAAPSVGRTGNVYLGAVDTVSGVTGFVSAVTSGGMKLWRNELGGVVASMPVGEFDGGERVFVAVNQTGTCTIARIYAEDGGSGPLSVPGATSCEGALALSETQAIGEPGPVETLYVALNNGASSEMQVLRPEGKSGSRNDV
ncbi:MAG: hypothetical protein M3Y59_24500, partial [Myxococcota bacterium]|nr:hypothetical protein [Myxococcota bacterium]